VSKKWIPPLSFFPILFIQPYFPRNQTDSKDLTLLQRRKLYQYRSKIPQKKKKTNTKTKSTPFKTLVRKKNKMGHKKNTYFFHTIDEAVKKLK
jgi:hypothetical protein